MWNVKAHVSITHGPPLFAVLDDDRQVRYTNPSFLEIIHWITTHGAGRFTIEDDVSWAVLAIDRDDDFEEAQSTGIDALPAGMEWSVPEDPDPPAA